MTQGPHRAIRMRTLLLGLFVLASVIAFTLAGTAASETTATGVILNVEAAPTGPIQANYNPFQQRSQFFQIGAAYQIYEPLMQWNPLRPKQITPWLATSAKWAKTGKALTIKLRHGVRWSDGKPFTAADVAYTFQLLKSTPALNGNGVSFSGVAAKGADTVVITFSQPSEAQEYIITGATLIVPKHIWSSQSDPGSYANPKPVGTGPFVLSSAGTQSLLLTKNTKYWQKGLPKIGGLRYIAFDANPSANLALSQGRLDWAGNFVPNINQQYVSKDPKHNFYWMVPRRTTMLCPNILKYPFGMVAVRKAMSMAIDRKAMSIAGEQGQQPPATTPTGLMLPAHISYLAPKYKNLRYKVDVAGAKKLLEDAGFKMGSNGIYNMPNGKPFKASILSVAPFTDVMIDMQVIAQQLKKIGMDVDVEGAAIDAWIGRSVVGDFDITFGCGGQPTDPSPFTLLNNALNSSFFAPLGKPAPFPNNYQRWKDSQTDAALNAYLNATTDAGRRLTMYAIEKEMVEKVPAIPIFYNVDFSEYRTTKVTGWPTRGNPYSSPSPTGPTAEVVAIHLTPVK